MLQPLLLTFLHYSFDPLHFSLNYHSFSLLIFFWPEFISESHYWQQTSMFFSFFFLDTTALGLLRTPLLAFFNLSCPLRAYFIFIFFPVSASWSLLHPTAFLLVFWPVSFLQLYNQAPDLSNFSMDSSKRSNYCKKLNFSIPVSITIVSRRLFFWPECIYESHY